MPGSVATHFNNHQPSEKDAWKIQPEDIGQIVVDLLKMNHVLCQVKLRCGLRCRNKQDDDTKVALRNLVFNYQEKVFC